MAIDMKAIARCRYYTRRLLPGDHFRVKKESEAKVFVARKQAERTDNPNRKVALDDARQSVGLPPLSADSETIAEVREEYFEALGRRPFNGWDIPTLKAKIAEAGDD